MVFTIQNIYMGVRVFECMENFLNICLPNFLSSSFLYKKKSPYEENDLLSIEVFMA
jgi:hypothetical protein